MLIPDTTALLVIDVQGKLARTVQQSEQLIENVRRCVQAANILEVPVIWIEQNPEGLGNTVPELAELMAQPALKKMTFNCCGSQEIRERLQQLNKTQLLVCGIESHVCVYQSVSGLLEQGYQVELICDAISSRTEANRELGITKMVELGARRSGTEMAIFELTGDSARAEFRDILAIVK